MKYRKYYFLLSGTFLFIGIVSIVLYGLPLGLDFTGGAIAEYKIPGGISTAEIESRVKDAGVEARSVSKSGDDSYLFRFAPLTQEDKTKVNEAISNLSGGAEELRFEVVGATFGPELLEKTLYAVGIAAFAILIWVAIQFKSVKFGLSAILAMFHDSLILIGSFALFGHFFGAEVDFLFVTAVLTTLSFSVHDTIVVYDRIRETQKKEGGELYDIANTAVSETMVRSLNNSFTIAFMLFALIILGGTSIRWFAVALFVGTVAGTYSSPFVAVPILSVVDSLGERFAKK